MKKIAMVIVTCLILTGLILVSAGCGSGQGAASEQETDTTTVQRGALTIEVTSVGNLELSQTEDLSFDLAGTVEEVLVNEGDAVTEGQELVRLDTSEWTDLIKTRERALATAQRALETAERLIGTKELAIRQEENDLATAEYNLTQIDEVEEAQDAIDAAEYNLNLAKAIGKYESETADAYTARLSDLRLVMEKAQQNLQDILSLNSMTLTTTVALQVQRYQLLVEQAQRALEDAQVALENAREDKEDAEENVEDAQSDLNEAKAKSPIIKAPFDGFITQVNVEGGDEVLRGTVAVQLANPDKFEADILVGELDILQVQLGSTATVEVDALSGLSLPAEVTHISPTASIQAGVVNYTVKVDIKSFEAVAENRQESRPGQMGEITPEAIKERMQQAVESGRMTQEQADAFIERMQSGEFPSRPGGTDIQPQAPVPDDFQLREGLTVTVYITVDSRTDVLLVPNAAISSKGQQSSVQVLSDNTTLEERVIEVGITDYQFTEIIDGLSEGETIIIPQGTATTVEQSGSSNRIMIPGMGRR
ncbi:HlyD family efflux transporter periplasmic adaptor subunit [Chloroflexota bacterium]